MTDEISGGYTQLRYALTNGYQCIVIYSGRLEDGELTKELELLNQRPDAVPGSAKLDKYID